MARDRSNVRLTRKFRARQTVLFVIYCCRYVVESHNKENEVNNNHMSALRIKHAELENRLEREENRPHPDSNLILSLKKRKLHLKDALMQDAVPA